PTRGPTGHILVNPCEPVPVVRCLRAAVSVDVGHDRLGAVAPVLQHFPDAPLVVKSHDREYSGTSHTSDGVRVAVIGALAGHSRFVEPAVRHCKDPNFVDLT